MAKLTFVLEDGQEIVVSLAEHITLGRSEDNDVVVDDGRISKRHAELARNADGTMQVFDLNSTAGTFVNGERVKSHTIVHGDRLSFGPLNAVLDLESLAGNGVPSNLPLGEENAATNGKIGPRRAGKGEANSRTMDKTTALPIEEVVARQQAEMRSEAAQWDAEKKRLTAEKKQLQAEVDALTSAANQERERIVPLKAAVQEAEAAHRDWLAAIQTLSTQHEEKSADIRQLNAQQEQKNADLNRLNADEAALRQELKSLATHRDEALAHLQQIRSDAAHDESVLDDLRRQVAEFQQRSQENLELAEAREDQVHAAEQKLEKLAQRRAQIEAHLTELTDSEERLTQALARSQKAESLHATTVQAIQSAEAQLKDLESRIGQQTEAHRKAATATDEALTIQRATEDSLQQVRKELAACEATLTTCKAELVVEQKQLEDTRARREQIERQCQDLAATEQTLEEARRQLATTESRLVETRAAVQADESRVKQLEASIKSLEGAESSAHGRLEVLQAREKDLRVELDSLSSAERAERTRFEEVRQLADEAERTHHERQHQIDASLKESQQNLAELLASLAPLREWKEAMDQLYARLSLLPQDSPEARDLWHEIEKEKAGLLDLVSVARTQALGTSAGSPKPSVRSQPTAGPGHGKRSITGAVPIPGTALESTMRARLGHLRESVQREETRLEQLRLERTRHETHARPGPAADAILREQSRHLEAKIRQEEERHHALQRNLESAQAEEERRRERLAEMEHKLAELRADITEAERLRSDLRQQADLIHTEIKNHEAALDRAIKKAREHGVGATAQSAG